MSDTESSPWLVIFLVLLLIAGLGSATYLLVVRTTTAGGSKSPVKPPSHSSGKAVSKSGSPATQSSTTKRKKGGATKFKEDSSRTKSDDLSKKKSDEPDNQETPGQKKKRLTRGNCDCHWQLVAHQKTELVIRNSRFGWLKLYSTGLSGFSGGLMDSPDGRGNFLTSLTKGAKKFKINLTDDAKGVYELEVRHIQGCRNCYGSGEINVGVDSYTGSGSTSNSSIWNSKPDFTYSLERSRTRNITGSRALFHHASTDALNLHFRTTARGSFIGTGVHLELDTVTEDNHYLTVDAICSCTTSGCDHPGAILMNPRPEFKMIMDMKHFIQKQLKTVRIHEIPDNLTDTETRKLIEKIRENTPELCASKIAQGWGMMPARLRNDFLKQIKNVLKTNTSESLRKDILKRLEKSLNSMKSNN